MEEDVLYNWIDSTTMIVSSFGKPFRARKKMHPLTLEAMIGARLMPKSFIVDFATSVSMYYYEHTIVALYFHFKISSNILFLSSNNVLACHNLGQHILAFDGDQKVFNKVFCPFFQDEGSHGEKFPKHSLDPKSPIHKCSKIDLDYE